ncbi:BamA/TamA family outer membrane protein [Tenacibaculum sp. nBUS_03]|uniref:translocation and assembly module lipoprotein TamL n=1 Tax=Tenacibaculum sp. nBUS_03 TaxID=3395320 RepID=UPI003EB8A702
MKKLSFILLLLVLFYSCNTIKYVKKNELLLARNTVFVDSVKTSDENLNELLIQRPNAKTFGLPLSLHFYNIGNPEGPKTPSMWGKKHPKTYSFFKNIFSEKQSISAAKSAISFNNWFLKSGQAPIIISDKKTKRTIENLNTYLQNQGYFKAKITSKKDTISSKKGAISYYINKGKALFIDSISREIKSPVLDSIYKISKYESYLKPNQQYNDQNFINEANRLTKLFRNNGVFHFDKNNSIDFYVSDTANYKTNIELVISDRTVEENGNYYTKPYKIQKIKRINVVTDYSYSKKNSPYKDSTLYKNVQYLAHDKQKYNPKYLSQSLFIKPNNVYSDSLRNLTRTHLRGLQNFKSTSIRFNELNDHELEANIFLTPKEKYTLSFDSELSRSNIRNFDVSGKFSLINRNTFKGAEIFKLSALGSYFNSNNGPGWELGSNISLEVPRFMAPFGLHKFVPKSMFPKTKFFAGINIQKNIGLDKQNISVGVDYRWKYNRKKTIQLELMNAQYIRNLNVQNYFSIYRSEYNKLVAIGKVVAPSIPIPLNISGSFNQITKYVGDIADKITDPNDLKTILNIINRYQIVTSDFLIPEIAYSFTYNNQQGAKDQSFSFFKIRVANSGNVMGILSKQKNENNQSTVFKIPVAQYFKTDIEYKKYWSLGNNSVLAHRTFLGAIFTYNNSEIPFSRSYFAGGSNDIRAWRTYDLGPGTRLPGLEYNIGSFKFLTSFEYRFDILGSLKGALFTDAGNIWSINNYDVIDESEKLNGFKSIKDLAVAGGFGLRYDFKFLIARLDLGFKIHEPYAPENKWFNNFNFSSSVLNIGINYPF